ncbi:MAG: two-component system, OmpR family, sensor histidine kinase BaeS [Parcubacteria bacterium C7867-004]|nr:MAG: two-component system, OmpR family, sensor histidine kinase BaeS [Parcubacteria bacterium C7867-004]
MFEITYAAAFVSVIFAVASIILFIRRRSALEVTLGTYLVLVTIWIGSNVIADVCYTTSCLYISCSLALMVAMLKVIVQFVLTDLLIDGRFPPWRRFLLYALPGIALAAASFSPHAILEMSFPIVRPAEIVPGVIYTYVFIYSLSNLLYGIARLAYALANKTGYTRRMQLWYALSGLILSGAGTLLFTVALPLTGEYRFYSLGPLCTIFFAMGCVYATTRHQLLDIKNAVRNGITYSLLITLVVGFYITIIVVLETFVTYSSDINILFASCIAVVVSAFSIPVIEKSFRKLTDKIFFKDTYDYAEAMHSLSEVLYTARTFEEFIDKVELKLALIFHSQSVRVLLTRESSCKNDVEQLDSDSVGTMSAPINSDGQTIGRIFVGNKLSGDPYEKRDLQLLLTFTNQAATCLSRVQLFMDVEKHAAELEQKVEERTQELKESRIREHQIITDLSHNLQTPLAILQTKLDRMDSRLRTDSTICSFEQSLKNFSIFIYDLLSLSQVESEANQVNDLFNLSELTHEVAEEITVIAGNRGIEVGLAIESGIYIYGDRKRMREAITNIASNSLKYMNEEGPKQIGFSLRTESDFVVLSIIDSGIGIAPTDLPYIFDRFYRGDHASRNIPGTGIGLAIVKRIVELHNGIIFAECGQNSGTTITIKIRVAK